VRTWKCNLAPLWLCLALVPCALAQHAGQNHDGLGRFVNALAQDGFVVSAGDARRWNPMEDFCAGTIPSAQAFNNEPYLQIRVPRSPEDPSLTRDFKLRPDEAIVLIGLTPPPVKYFSYTPYLATRVYGDGNGQTRKQLLASLGDGVNNAVIRSIGSTPFNSPMAIVFTPDRATDARVRAALQRAGYPAAMINTVVFPASMPKLGFGETADELNIVTRTAVWQSQAEADAYTNDPPLTILRVTPGIQATASPFRVPPLRVRGTGRTEMDLMNKLDQLRQGIVDTYERVGLQATDVPTVPMCYEGYDLIQRRMWCGDSRDALYIAAGNVDLADPAASTDITLGDDEFLMVYGVNHVATGKATYMNLNFYADPIAALFVGSISDKDFPAAASNFLAGDPAAGLMYAYKVSRNCTAGEPNCLQLSVPDGCTRLTLDSSTLLTVFERIYLEPATRIGPALPEMVYDRVLKFSPRPPEQPKQQ
jgi:hypothetical protein